MVGTSTITSSQVDVHTPAVGRQLRSDLRTASDGNSFRCDDLHNARILARPEQECRASGSCEAVTGTANHEKGQTYSCLEIINFPEADDSLGSGFAPQPYFGDAAQPSTVENRSIRNYGVNLAGRYPPLGRPQELASPQRRGYQSGENALIFSSTKYLGAG